MYDLPINLLRVLNKLHIFLTNSLIFKLIAVIEKVTIIFNTFEQVSKAFI